LEKCKREGWAYQHDDRNLHTCKETRKRTDDANLLNDRLACAVRPTMRDEPAKDRMGKDRLLRAPFHHERRLWVRLDELNERVRELHHLWVRAEDEGEWRGVGREKRVSKRATIWDVMTGKLSVPKLSDRAKNRSGKREHPSVRWFSGRGENVGVGRKGDVRDQKARVLAVLLEHALNELDRRVRLGLDSELLGFGEIVVPPFPDTRRDLGADLTGFAGQKGNQSQSQLRR
jgi:hypothetical protein